jgi:hypothetical protein
MPLPIETALPSLTTHSSPSSDGQIRSTFPILIICSRPENSPCGQP